MSRKGSREIFIEFIIQANVVKATAIDPITGLEASIVGPVSAPKAVLAEQARRKLEFLAKKKT